MKCKNWCRGSITVEAALLVPIVIIVLLVVFNLALLVFQTGIMYSAANDTAERIAAAYYTQGSSLLNGAMSKQQIQDLELYRRWNGNFTSLADDFKGVALLRLKEDSLLRSKKSIFEIVKSGNVFNRSITVALSSTYDNPLGSITSVWGLGREITINVNAEASVDDPAEFIRNTDYILQTAARIPIIKDFGTSWRQIINSVVDYINDSLKGLGNS